MTLFCFVICSSSKQSLNQELPDPTAAAIAADNVKANNGGKVVAGSYVPTKEEIFHHKQVQIQF